jgi:hypothetical protein
MTTHDYTQQFSTGWCRAQFDMLALGGVWGVPRSGLVFRKESEDPDVLRLAERMPFSALPDDPDLDIPHSEAELVAYQDDDFDVIQREFALAGIAVER